MAKLIVTEVYEGTNEEIKEIQRVLDESAKAKENKYVRENLKDLNVEASYDETVLQKRLRKELAMLRPFLNRKTIQMAENLISSFDGTDTTDEELLDSLLEE